jgi:hypothetical protein
MIYAPRSRVWWGAYIGEALKVGRYAQVVKSGENKS